MAEPAGDRRKEPMRHIKLVLKGFVGIQAAQGRSQIALDLESESSALIALTGPNGSGKTTVVDNLHPYLTMPSRATAGGAFSYYEHIADEASKEYEFELNGVRFRQVARWRKTARTRTGESHLLVRDESGVWQPFVSSSGLASDGKLDTYQRIVEDLVGPASLYFTAIHQCQGRRPIYAATNAEAKDLMVRMLGLADVPAIGAKATAVEKALGTEIDAANAAIARATDEQRLAEQTAITQRDSASARLRELSNAIAVATGREHGLLARRDALNAAAAKSEALVARARAIDEAIATERASAAREQAGVIEGRDRVIAETGARQRELDRALKDRREEQQRLQSLQAGRPNLVSLREEIASAKARRASVNAEMQAATQTLDAAQAAVVTEAEIAAKSDGLQARTKTEADAGKAKAGELEVLTKQVSVIATVPCGNQPTLVQGCPLLVQARDAQARVHVVRDELDQMRIRYAELLASQRALVTPNVAAKRALLTAATVARDRKATELAALDRQIAREGELATREAALSTADSSLPGVVAEVDRLVAEIAEAERTISRERSDADSRVAAIRQVSADAIGKLETEKRALNLDSASTDLATVERELADLRLELSRLRTEDTDLQAKAAVADANLSRAREGLVQADARRKALDGVVATRETWATLAKAFSANGIVALIIDDAGPTLAAIANELLLECYGARFTVEIITQIRTTTGALKEGFDVVVHDSRDNSSKSVAVMSGGERIWIEQSVIRAISIHLAHRSGRQYLSLVSDEADGALDEDNKRLFVTMLRKALHIGEFEQQIFISQSPELWAMADKAIDVTTL